MSLLESAIVILLIVLSLSYLLRGAWKKARASRDATCCRGRCGCSTQKKASAARQ